jgi:acyl-coenzyme A thioesterase PaaI-like protein
VAGFDPILPGWFYPIADTRETIGTQKKNVSDITNSARQQISLGRERNRAATHQQPTHRRNDMTTREHEEISNALQTRMRQGTDHLVIPPPAFLTMQGEFLEYDETTQTLVTRFPVLPTLLNPFGTMQGGMVAAAVDNTIGPLSMLVAPASVTRRLEMKYSRGVSVEDRWIIVTARLVERKKRRLLLDASVKSPRGIEMASATSVHWIIDGLTRNGS